MEKNRLRRRFILITTILILPNHGNCFTLRKTLVNTHRHPKQLPLNAKKAKNKKVRRSTSSTSGFGGAAAESCPCGSEVPYAKCCRKLHKDMNAFLKATPEQVVRARYTAYAKREIDFIMKSTHPKNKTFNADIKHWRSQIDTNCYDNFELTKCQILEETLMDDKTATVAFVANMVQRDSRERTAFKETSTFEKSGGAWLYKEGEISDPPGRTTEKEKEDSKTQQAAIDFE